MKERARTEFRGIRMRCPRCGEYMVHTYVPELEAFTFFCEKCKLAAVPAPLIPSDFGFEPAPLPDFGDGGWEHFIGS